MRFLVEIQMEKEALEEAEKKKKAREEEVANCSHCRK